MFWKEEAFLSSRHDIFEVNARQNIAVGAWTSTRADLLAFPGYIEIHRDGDKGNP
jgi:hypothetical protein